MHHHHHHGSSCHHNHGHSHGHHHVPKNFDRRFAIGAGINMAFVVAELGFGFFSKSLGLISDAVHNFSDVVGLLLAWGGAWLARRKPTQDRTYGFSGASILSALGNAGLLLIATGAIILQAIQRFFNPADVDSPVIIWVALIGIAVNFATALLFYKDKNHDINVRGAYLHMMADAAVSLGVVIAGFIIMNTGWQWIDPVIGLVIAGVILLGTWDLAKEALHLSLAGVPRHVDRNEVHAYLKSLPGVTDVHDLHIWAMSTTQTALTAHLTRPELAPDDAFLDKVADELNHRFRIQHPTLQIEKGGHEHACRLAPEEVI